MVFGVGESFEAAGSCATGGEPYTQAVALVKPPLFVAAAGGGGGAAQLFPARLLGPLVERAVEAACAQGRAADELVVAFLCAADAAMGSLLNERLPPAGTALYAGASAQAVVAAVDAGGSPWVGSAGLGRAWRVASDRLVQLTRDDSVAEDLAGTHGVADGVGAAAAYDGLVTATLNGHWRELPRGFRPTRVDLADGEGVLLATRAVFEGVPRARLHGWAREAVQAEALGPAVQALLLRARAQSPQPAVFARTASVVVVRRA